MEATGQPSLPLENDPDRLGLFDNEEQRVLANALEDPLLRREMDMLIEDAADFEVPEPIGE